MARLLLTTAASGERRERVKLSNAAGVVSRSTGTFSARLQRPSASTTSSSGYLRIARLVDTARVIPGGDIPALLDVRLMA